MSVGFGTTLTKYKYLMGWVAVMAGYFIIATAVGYLRRNKFNFFFYAHFAFLFWFAGAAFHSKDCRIYVIAATALYLIDRIGRLMQGLCPRKSTMLRVKVRLLRVGRVWVACVGRVWVRRKKKRNGRLFDRRVSFFCSCLAFAFGICLWHFV